MSKSLEDRFWKFVNKTDGCWLWTGSNDGGGGYGRIKYGTKNIGSHRASWIIHHGKIPEGLQICHICDNPPCVRPDHLFLGTNQQNLLDCVAKGRNHVPDNRGSRHGMSKLSEKDIEYIRLSYIPRKQGNRAAIANHLGVSVGTVNSIIWRQRWKHTLISVEEVG